MAVDVPEGYERVYIGDNPMTGLAMYGLQKKGSDKPTLPKEVQEIIDKRPNQKKLFQRIRRKKNGSLSFPQYLDPVLKAYAEKISKGVKEAVGDETFPLEGSTWEDLDKEVEEKGGGGFGVLTGPLGALLPESFGKSVRDTLFGREATIENRELLNAQQQALQDQAIKQAMQNLGLLSQPAQVPAAPGMPNLPPPAQLNYNLPGIGEPRQQPPGFSGLRNLINPGAGFEPIAAEARRQLETKAIPTIAERFANFGGAGRTSGYGRAILGARADLESQLASLGAQYENQARQQLFTETSAQNQQQTTLENLINQLAQNQNTQQLERERLRNELGLGVNTQRLAEQGQTAQQQLGLGQLAGQQYGAAGTNALEANRQQAQGVLSLLQTGLQPRTQPVVNPGSQGILPSFGQGLAQAAPSYALSYATGLPLQI